MTQQAVSLQSKLIKTSMLSSVVAGLVAFILLIGLSIYQTMQVQDEIMDEIADMLMISDLSSTSGSQIDELSDEFDIQYQLSNHNMLLTQSAQFDLNTQNPRIFAQQDAYSFIWSDDRLLRSYQVSDHETKLNVYVIQPLSIRFKDLLQSFISYLFILFSLWLMQWGISHFLIRKQFKPIQQLSKEISEKSAHDLSLIHQPQPELKELQPMVNQLNQMLTRLDQSLIAEQRFTADASHELRSPLSAIQMRLQLLQRQYAEIPELKPQLQLIQNDVNRGTQVLENLLLLARLDPMDEVQLPRTWISVDTLTQDVLKTLEPLINEKQIQIHMDGEDCKIYANAELIFICIRNLIDNAIRYRPIHGHIYICFGHLNNQIFFEIENDGQGVTQDVLDRLGERFYRALGTQTQGSGLGLSICKKIIALHQGQIEFKSSEYGGLNVTLYLR
ncbi:MAG: HAMP domain-containing sensor histidine kinase [Acinetobacter sp.]